LNGLNAKIKDLEQEIIALNALNKQNEKIIRELRDKLNQPDPMIEQLKKQIKALEQENKKQVDTINDLKMEMKDNELSH
jgi:chromosome segregation ATPase